MGIGYALHDYFKNGSGGDRNVAHSEFFLGSSVNTYLGTTAFQVTKGEHGGRTHEMWNTFWPSRVVTLIMSVVWLDFTSFVN